MNLVEIKQKYKQILEEPQSQHSDDQWEMAYSRMKNKRRRHVLTQSNCANYPIKENNDDCAILKLKQKLAQCISNLNRKDKQLNQINEQNRRLSDKNRQYEKQIKQLKQTLTNQQQRIIQNKIAYGCIEKDYTSLQKIIQSHKLDKQLMKKQVQYFEDQVKAYKNQITKREHRIDEIKAEFQSYQKYKTINSKLKIDISRLKQLLAQTDKYRIFASQIQNKHYLGKISKEHQCWFSQQLILECQKFIKKNKIGSNTHNFKDLVAIIVRFVNKYSEDQKKKVQKKAKKVLSSRIKQIQRKQNHSLNYMEIRGQTLKKSMMRSSLCRSIRSNVLNQSKKCTESFIYDKLQKSLVTHEVNQHRDLCVEMLGSFRKGVIQLISCKKIKTKKLMKLVDWVIQGILSVFPKERQIGDIPIQSQQIKIVQ